MEKSQGNLRAAVELFQRGLARAPEHGSLWQAYAKLEAERKNVTGARALFAEGLARAPSHAQLIGAAAKLELGEGQTALAARLVQGGLAQPALSRGAELHTLRVQIALKAADRTAARQYYEVRAGAGPGSGGCACVCLR
jgi:tetratricopeptide (TPR) repeat protein